MGQRRKDEETAKCSDLLGRALDEKWLSDIVRDIGICLEERRCLRGVLSSNQSYMIRFIESGPYYELLNRLKESLKGDKDDHNQDSLIHRCALGLMSRGFKIYIGILEGRYFITSHQAVVGDTVDLSHYPMSFYLSHIVVISYMKLLRSLEVTLPRDIEKCSLHADKTKCYRYVGASNCVFNYVSRCPLRLLLSDDGLNSRSAIGLIKRAISLTYSKNSEDYSAIRETDRILTREILELLYYLAMKAAHDDAKIMRIKLEFELPSIHSRKHPNEFLNVKIRKILKYAWRTVETIFETDDPYQSRTKIIVMLETLPNILKIISEHLVYDSLYKYCTQTVIDDRIIKGLVEFYYPFLRGRLSGIISQKVSRILSEDGCIEPHELAEGISKELAFKILEKLSEKNVLSKVQSDDRHIFIAGRALERSTR